MKRALSILGRQYQADQWTNISSSVIPLIERRLHLKENHPISILRQRIESRFPQYSKYNRYSPVVTIHQNFDSLGFPKDHVGRSKSDTYYINKELLLRTHTSAHQAETFKECSTPGFLITADVYRRDEIDSSHYPVFHQTEGARVFDVSPDLEAQIEDEIAAMPANVVVEDVVTSPSNPYQSCHSPAHSEAVGRHLKRSIEMLAAEVFQAHASREPLKVRWIEAYFPFTSPSWELEVWFNGEWLELCGCGVVQQQILNDVGKTDTIGWAFGLGLERIAMILFGIPDIRLFWSQDERFTKQFNGLDIVTFKEYSKYPLNKKDMSFWINDFSENDFMEIVRATGGDLIESVKQVDKFEKGGRTSLCYRITYRSMDRSLSNEEINRLQLTIQQQCVEQLGVEMR